MIARILRFLAIVAMVALAACAGAPSESTRVTNVSTEAGRGYVTVRWELAGSADRFEVFRTEVGDEASLEPIASIADGSARSFEDLAVDPGVPYRYAVSVDGGQPVDGGGEGVRPERGNQLQILFGDASPEGVSVRSEPAGIECATAGSTGCTGEFAAILDVALSVESVDDARVAWEGCDEVLGETCVVSMAVDRSILVFVGSAIRALGVEVEAPGMGRVSNVNDLGTNQRVDCSDTCTYVYPDDLIIGLRADPIGPEDHRFVAWDGACAESGSSACTVTMNESKSVRAVFELIPVEIASFEAEPDRIWPREAATLSWSVSGGGDVRVSIEPNIGDVTGREEVEVSPNETTVYTLTASNGDSTDTAAVRVHVRSWPFGSLEDGLASP